MNDVKDYTKVKVLKKVKKKIQILAACQKTSEERVFEQLIRCGLEVYLAEQTNKADTAVAPSSVPSLARNKNSV
jgi:hypothetical protein